MANLKVLTPIGRTSFMYVLKTTDNYEGDGQEYALDLLFKKRDNLLGGLEAAYHKVVKEEFGAKPGKVRSLYEGEKAIFKDGDIRYEEDSETYEMYEGCFYMSFHRPEEYGILPVVDENREDIINRNEFHSGQNARCFIELSAYKNKWGKMVSTKLLSVQRQPGGEPIGNSSIGYDEAIDAFSESPEEDFDIF